MKHLTCYIGYDSREIDAFRVAKKSLLRHSSIPVLIGYLMLSILRQNGVYTRPHRLINGQMIDGIDGRPFSTQFAFSRFLVPYLQEYKGWAIFCDCDFLFTGDIAELIPLLDDTKAVMVVKHDHIPSETVKMDGQAQQAYPRKCWSSFIAWNCAHPSNRGLGIRAVNTQSGRWLHGFSWLSDDEIGELPQTWNWLAGVSKPLPETPKAIHFTLGTPDLEGYENSPYADLWRAELKSINRKEIKYG